jgi:hypothetical protein
MLLLVIGLFAAPLFSEPAGDMPVIDPASVAGVCPETPMSLARKMGKTPRAVPLSKLPPAQTFMAVDRRFNGCPAPLTMSDYRSPHQR